MTREEKLRHWITIFSRWLLAEVLFMVSMIVLGPWVQQNWTWPVLILLALVFVTTRYSDIEESWRLVALQIFAVLSGALFDLLLAGKWGRQIQTSTFIGIGGVILAIFLGERFLPIQSSLNRMLGWLSWPYLVGWIFLWKVPGLEGWGQRWALVGFSLFLLLTAFWSASLVKGEDSPDHTLAGAQLFFFSLNLTLSAFVWLTV